jgi:hypothetical protein
MIRISAPLAASTPDPDKVSITEMLAIIDGNRGRTRTLGTMILTVCGMLLSATFVIVFFILSGGTAPHQLQALLLFLFSALLLMGAIFASLVSATLTLPISAPKKLALLNTATRIYRREVRWVRAAVGMLMVAVLTFAAALASFAFRILHSQISFSLF